MEYTRTAHLMARYVRDELGQESTPAIDIETGRITPAVKMELGGEGESFLITWTDGGIEYLTIIDPDESMTHYRLNAEEIESLYYLYKEFE